MWSDVIDLRDFYETALGQAAGQMIRRQLRSIWPDISGARILGLGFPLPYLLPFRDECERMMAVMPSSQGVLHWPPGEPGLVCLAEESELPLPDRSVDRVLLVHALESTEQVRATLREVWRVLADGGRLLVVTPNRRGLWAHIERTPFGQGRPYTTSQLNRLLRENMYTPLQVSTALYMPPFQSRVLLRSALAWEQVGGRWFQAFAGVLVMEAAKQIYAGSALRDRPSGKRAFLPMPQG
ncbi:MAG TPA: methyltransferase domain-containing protein [Rhodospirillaceae bacterium]|nr:methyltransferase domain-containing protein [Rhodospirillaceae bacterium]